MCFGLIGQGAHIDGNGFHDGKDNAACPGGIAGNGRGEQEVGGIQSISQTK